MTTDVIADWGRAFAEADAAGDVERMRLCFEHALKQWRLADERERRTLGNVRTMLAVMESSQ